MYNNIKNQYSLVQKIKLAYCLIRTKLFYPKARLIRSHFDLRGGEFVDLGKSITIGKYCRIEAFSTCNNKSKKILFGSDVQINDFVHISAIENVVIEDNVLIAGNVYISDNSHGSYKGDENDSDPSIKPIDRPYFTKPVRIGANSWIGESVIILPGANIGKGCVIGAHTIVTGDSYPDFSIIVGSPARVIKRYDHQTKCWRRVDKDGNFIEN